MAAAILTLLLAFLAAGGAWLGLGPRLKLAQEVRQNDLLNLVAYAGLALPLAFAIVFYVLELI